MNSLKYVLVGTGCPACRLETDFETIYVTAQRAGTVG